ncbi:MAG: TolC family protein [Chloroflexi bacterium]|nr:TolC family protein [Chloroflexota bacterium]
MLVAFVTSLNAAEPPADAAQMALPQTNRFHLIDLPTALRLAGAQNLDVQLAREKLAEAKANRDVAVAQFFPWLSPGITYRRHDNLIQETTGNILDVHKQSYAPGATLGSTLDLGDAIYRSLTAKQLAEAAGQALEAQRQETTLAAAQGYFDLLMSQTGVSVAQEAVGISANYEQQVQHAVAAGIAFKGDQLRVKVQAERNRLLLRQALEQQRNAAARLAQTLRLDPAVALAASEADLAPLTLVEPTQALDSLVQQALLSRPESGQNRSLVEAARQAQKGAVYGPLVPSLGAQAFFGGLGGGKRGGPGSLGEQEDYAVGLAWRIGPGGLFDSGRIQAADARRSAAQIQADKTRDDITRQVVEAFTRFHSLADQMDIAKQALTAAEEGLRLAQARKEFAVGIVLENIQAEQDLTRARLDYLKAVVESNKAQYALSRAVGRL